MAQQKIDPFYIDSNIATSTDFHLHMTDYVDLLITFSNECATNSIYWHTNSHSDPITSKINFFKDLHNKSLKVSDNTDGVVKKKASKDDLVNKNVRDQLPPGAHLKTASGNKYDKPQLSGSSADVTTTTRTRQWSPDGNQDDDDSQANGKWETENVTKSHKVEVTKPSATQDSPPALESTYGLSEMGVWNVMWWIEKFNTSHEVVKNELKEMLGGGNVYFAKFSESVGQLKNLSDTWDTSTLPVWDTQVGAYGTKYSIPSTIPGVARYCMRDEAIAFGTQLSKHTNKTFRENISHLMEDPSQDQVITGPVMSFTTMSHGNNMVNDFMHTSRMMGAIEVIQGVLLKHLKGLYEVLDMLSNRDNLIVSDKPKQILCKVEDFTVAVDLLKNKIKSYVKDDTETVPNSRYGKYTTYNTPVTNKKKLTSS